MTPAKTAKTPKPTTALVQKAPPRRGTPAVKVAINVSLPVQLHRKLRVRQIEEDLTLAEAVEAAVTAWVKA